jgi:hypothetical protein
MAQHTNENYFQSMQNLMNNVPTSDTKFATESSRLTTEERLNLLETKSEMLLARVDTIEAKQSVSPRQHIPRVKDTVYATHMRDNRVGTYRSTCAVDKVDAYTTRENKVSPYTARENKVSPYTARENKVSPMSIKLQDSAEDEKICAMTDHVPYAHTPVDQPAMTDVDYARLYQASNIQLPDDNLDDLKETVRRLIRANEQLIAELRKVHKMYNDTQSAYTKSVYRMEEDLSIKEVEIFSLKEQLSRFDIIGE